MRKAPLVLVLALSAGGLWLATRDRTEDPRALTERGYAALGQSDFGEAAASFDRALRALPETDSARPRAAMGLVEALAHIDADESGTRFLAYAKTQPRIPARSYAQTASWLHQSGGSSAAVVVLDAGIERFPESSAEFEAQKQTILAAELSPEEMEKLRGLGYVAID